MKQASALSIPLRLAILGSALRAAWFVVVPVLLTALVLRYLLPSHVRAPEGALRALSDWAEPRLTTLAVVFFLFFAALIRYWRALLPGAELWASPAEARPRASESKYGSWAWLALVIVAGATALGLRGSVFQSYRVLSGSMLPTLQPGEVLLSKQYAYGAHLPWRPPAEPRAPERGDVVIFRRPPIRPDVPEELVKRVIGLPGDTITSFGGFVAINGWQIPSCYVGPYVFIAGDSMLEAQLRIEYLEDRAYLTAHAPALPEHSEPYTVKPGEVYVLGDNRNNSSDSRAWNEGHGGGLGFSEIRGKVERYLYGQHRDGSSDFSLFLKPVGVDVRAEGIDTADLNAAVERCLQTRPKQTRPPRPQAVQP